MGKILMFLREELHDDPGILHVTKAQVGKGSQIRTGDAREAGFAQRASEAGSKKRGGESGKRKVWGGGHLNQKGSFFGTVN